jgi:glyoxylase-like metal-dependent hydrolase (beta-lactamase superfamily II)
MEGVVVVSAGIELSGVTIQQVIEQEGAFFDALDFFPSLTREQLEANRSWLQPRYIDPATDKIILCVQSFIIRTAGHTILVDTCVGNHKPRPARPFWDMLASDRYLRGLAAAGVGVDDVDYVMCTHLHVDHVGWNTRLESGRWVPTFPNARYLFAERELAYWTERQKEDPTGHPWITDSVLPIVATGRAELVRSDHELDELVRLVPSPGHTIDHFSVLVGRPGHDALITGDMIHSPLQACYPELGMRSDYSSPLAGATRRRLLGDFCDTATLMCASHFAAPSLGRFTAWDDGFRFVQA